MMRRYRSNDPVLDNDLNDPRDTNNNIGRNRQHTLAVKRHSAIQPKQQQQQQQHQCCHVHTPIDITTIHTMIHSPPQGTSGNNKTRISRIFSSKRLLKSSGTFVTIVGIGILCFIHTLWTLNNKDQNTINHYNDVDRYYFADVASTTKFIPNHTMSTLWNDKKDHEIILPQKLVRQLTPLTPMDREYYTVRINTWRRPEQLVASVVHHASCAGVKKVQIVWCDTENEPPEELLHHPHASKVVIERHKENSLNERFRIVDPTPTLGILTMDDDVLRPCEAMDAGFFKWVQNPHRMIGFDARTHVENNSDGSWAYGYLSTTTKENKYSMSLTRYCFVHRDYMEMYMNQLPPSILHTVAKHFNCEDVAMSFMISSLTHGQPPLLADLWTIKTQMKLHVDDKISGGKNHKHLRDECVNSFATILGLKTDNVSKSSSHRLQMATFVHGNTTWFQCGAKEDSHKDENYTKSEREIEHMEMIEKWKSLKPEKFRKKIVHIMSKAGEFARERNLL